MLELLCRRVLGLGQKDSAEVTLVIHNVSHVPVLEEISRLRANDSAHSVDR